MKEEELLQRLKASATIPSMPKVICRFLDIVRDPVFSYDDLVDVLSTDPGLTGDVLKMANS
ncbi:MAG: HDOD domain-containing protein, partial [Phycisphaerales bacterium]